MWTKRIVELAGIMCLSVCGCTEDRVSQAERERTIRELEQQVAGLREDLRDALDATAAYREHVRQLHAHLVDSIDDIEDELLELRAHQESADDLLIEQVLDSYDNLAIRIEQLESSVARNAVQPGHEAGSSDADAPQRLMRITRIETLPPDRSSEGRIQELREQAERREQEARELDRAIADLLQVYRDWELHTRRGLEYRDRYRDRMTENRNKRRELSRHRRQLQHDARRLTGEALALERDAATPRQRIIGTTDDTTIILETERDFSGQLSRFPEREWVTWTGRITRHDEDEQVWVVRRIELLDMVSGR